MRDWRLSDLKQMCKEYGNVCNGCPIGETDCAKYFDRTCPADWQIDENDHKNILEGFKECVEACKKYCCGVYLYYRGYCVGEFHPAGYDGKIEYTINKDGDLRIYFGSISVNVDEFKYQWE